jgi:hypothetical protein
MVACAGPSGPARDLPALLGCCSGLCRLPNTYFTSLRHQEQGEHEPHRGNCDRIDQRVLLHNSKRSSGGGMASLYTRQADRE